MEKSSESDRPSRQVIEVESPAIFQDSYRLRQDCANVVEVVLFVEPVFAGTTFSVFLPQAERRIKEDDIRAVVRQSTEKVQRVAAYDVPSSAYR